MTLIGEEASSIGPPNWSTEATVVLKPDGSTRTSSPARNCAAGHLSGVAAVVVVLVRHAAG